MALMGIRQLETITNNSFSPCLRWHIPESRSHSSPSKPRFLNVKTGGVGGGWGGGEREKEGEHRQWKTCRLLLIRPRSWDHPGTEELVCMPRSSLPVPREGPFARHCRPKHGKTVGRRHRLPRSTVTFTCNPLPLSSPDSDCFRVHRESLPDGPFRHFIRDINLERTSPATNI